MVFHVAPLSFKEAPFNSSYLISIRGYSSRSPAFLTFLPQLIPFAWSGSTTSSKRLDEMKANAPCTSRQEARPAKRRRRTEWRILTSILSLLNPHKGGKSDCWSFLLFQSVSSQTLAATGAPSLLIIAFHKEGQGIDVGHASCKLF